MDELHGEMAAQARLQSEASSGVINTQRMLESQRYQLHLLSQIQTIKDNIALIEQECERRQQLLVSR